MVKVLCVSKERDNCDFYYGNEVKYTDTSLFLDVGLNKVSLARKSGLGQ